MRFRGLAELSAYHEKFYAEQKKRIIYLLDRQYIRQFIRKKFVSQPMDGIDLSSFDAYQRMRFEPSFESQVIKYAEDPDAAGALAHKIRYAREPRRKAAAGGLSRREIVRQFASQPVNANVKTKSLWVPFFDELVRLRLNPDNASADDVYEYDGKRGRLTIRYRQFEKLVSELAPRKKRISGT